MHWELSTMGHIASTTLLSTVTSDPATGGGLGDVFNGLKDSILGSVNWVFTRDIPLPSFENVVTTTSGFFFDNWFAGLSQFLLGFINNIMGIAYTFMDLPFIISGIAYAQVTALTIIAPKLLFEAYQTYVMYESGDPDADPTGLLWRCGGAVTTIAFLPDIVRIVMKFGTLLANDVTKIPFPGDEKTSFMNLLSNIATATQAITSTVVPGFGSIIGLIIVVMLLWIAFQAGARGAELAIHAVSGSFVALSLTSPNKGSWETWFRQVIVICATQGLQLFMLKGAFYFMGHPPTSGEPGQYFIQMIGWLYITIKTPKFIQTWVHSTGTTSTAGAGIRSVAGNTMGAYGRSFASGAGGAASAARSVASRL